MMLDYRYLYVIFIMGAGIIIEVVGKLLLCIFTCFDVVLKIAVIDVVDVAGVVSAIVDSRGCCCLCKVCGGGARWWFNCLFRFSCCCCRSF